MTVYAVWHPDYLKWKLGDDHPTNPIRAKNALDLLADDQLLGDKLNIVPPRGATGGAVRDVLRSVHSHEYVSSVLDRGECHEWEGVNYELAGVAELMFAGTYTAVSLPVSWRDVWFVPMGAKHHAQHNWSSGFCVFNDFAWAAKILSLIGDVLYLDWDAHHGDGVENLTAATSGVTTCSVHDGTIFPGTGHSNRPTEGVYNWPLERGSGDGELLDAVDAMLGVADGLPDLGHLLLAAGADGLKGDPLSTLTYTQAGIYRAAKMVGEYARDRELKVLIGGAGGYQPHDETPIAWALTVAAIHEELQR